MALRLCGRLLGGRPGLRLFVVPLGLEDGRDLPEDARDLWGLAAGEDPQQPRQVPACPGHHSRNVGQRQPRLDPAARMSDVRRLGVVVFEGRHGTR